MMTRPYLILPVMIEQPTWGGEYIASFKGWSHVKAFQGKKIGQSYELYGKSTLLTGISDTTDKQFVELASNPLTQPQTGQILLEEAVSQHADGFLGRGILEKFGTMPLLIKFTQALGNSFQLHVPSGTAEPAWKPKPESWYYLENGVVTFGIH
ncbi:MAG: hypothetical protein Q7S76_00555, partial [bacterium]|nr:hypothetical protein [bacterium]